MMRNRTVYAVLALCSTMACGTRHGAALTPREVTELRPALHVTNIGHTDVTVNLVRDEVRFRLGRIRAQTTEIYSVANPLLVGTKVYVEVLSPGQLQGHVVGPVALVPRSGFRVVVGDIPELTTAITPVW